jgi:succinate dehydrogenase / fumarate reductase cytochrome b subunit
MAVSAQPVPAHAVPRGNFITRNHFWLRRLHSLSGIVPIGGFLIYHFWENSKVFQGMAAYNEMAASVRDMQLIVWLEIFGIGLPILFHALYGLYIAYYAKSNTSQYAYPRNWMFTAQRLSGLWALAFLVYHYATLRFGAFWTEHADYMTMSQILGQPIPYAFYVVSIVLIAFHFANGLWAFMVTWGITVSRTAQRYSAVAMAGVFFVLSVWGIAIGTRFFLAGQGIIV